MFLRTKPWVLGIVALLVSAMTGCSQDAATSEPPTEPPAVVTNPDTTGLPREELQQILQGAAVSRFTQRINQIDKFKFEGFERKGPPRSQIATVPPIWTGERVRGEESELGAGAVFLFTSANDESLIMVDIAYVEGLPGSGILRTAWLDDEIAAEAGTCSNCTHHEVKQFYEPSLVYTVTEMRGDGSIYLFTEALMQHLRDNPLAE